MRRAPIIAAAAIAAALIAAAPAAADSFGISGFDVTYTGPNGEEVTQAGAHPYQMETSFKVNTKEREGGEGIQVPEFVKDIETAQIPGLAGNPTAVAPCTATDFLSARDNPETVPQPRCPDGAAVGIVAVESISVAAHGGSEVVGEEGPPLWSPVYRLEAPPGVALELGFWTANVPVTIQLGVSEAPPYEPVGGPRNISQVLEVTGSRLILWGTPDDPSHDALRGFCVGGSGPEPSSFGKCSAGGAPKPLLTMPRACGGPLATSYALDSWSHPGAKLANGRPDLSDPAWLTGSAQTHDASGPAGMSGCSALGFSPETSAKPTSQAAESSSGLDFSLDTENEGLENAAGLADADIEKTVVTLPEGMTANPSSANGLGVCTEAQLAAETPSSAPGEGCPEASKLGTIEVETPLLEETLKGSLYLAKPYENPEGTLIALYMVIKSAKLGVIFRIPLRVEPDPRTGQLITTAEDLPQWPFAHFRLHFREGARSPLVTPPGCGAKTVKALLYPSTGGPAVESDSSFQIVSGPDGAPCPQGALPFHPGFEAGTENNAAGVHSPFDLRLTRQDGDQDLTKISTALPQGVLASLVGVSKCSDAQIAQARSRTGPSGGHEEQASPSCPASSQIGTTMTGAGVGSLLTWVPGNLYLAGPYNGAPLSVVAIVPGVAGPFDVGTIVVRLALRFNPVTAQAEADGSSSDPIPHILRGIPLKVRDIRVYVNRPEWIFNPTSCEAEATVGTLWGGGQNASSTLDDSPYAIASRFQAADCASLAFKPNLKLNLKGGSRRGSFPALRGEYKPRPGDANLNGLVLRLPHSEFIEQGHFKTICTRVQYAAGQGFGSECPSGSVYGWARAYTPLLEEPLEGPVRLRSSNHNLPDLVASLHGIADIEAVARIDSKKGGLRATFSNLPDAPITKVVVSMQGGQKGLIVNSTNLCSGKHRADAKYTAQSGKRAGGNPLLRVKCKKTKKHRRHHKRRSGR